MADMTEFLLGWNCSSLLVGHHKESAFSIKMYHLETFGSTKNIH